MSDWEKPSELESLLREARGDGASPERLDRVRVRLEAALGASLASPGSEAAPAPGGSAPAQGTSSALLFGVASAGALGIAAWLFFARQPPPTDLPAPAPPVEATAEPAPHALEPAVERTAENTAENTAEHTAENTVEGAPPASPPSAEPPAPTAAPETGLPAPTPTRAGRAAAEAEALAPAELDPGLAPPGSTLREEIALVERAMAARDAGDVARARSVLEQHRARFPDGVLRPERERILLELSGPSVAPGAEALDPAASP